MAYDLPISEVIEQHPYVIRLSHTTVSSMKLVMIHTKISVESEREEFVC